MHLVHQSLEGKILPDKLPKNLVPPDKEHYFSNSTSINNSMLCLPPITGDADFNLALVPVQSTSELNPKQSTGYLSALVSVSNKIFQSSLLIQLNDFTYHKY